MYKRQVQVDPDHAVPWTKPADYVFDPQDPLRGLGSVVCYDAWLGVKCDGSVFTFDSRNKSSEGTCAMFTRDAGDAPPDQW